MENFKKITKQQSPARTIAFGFAVLIFIGAALLSLPIAVRGAGQLPGLDCVSFGPDLVDIHTAREKMSISSVQRTWKFLLGVLEALKD